MWNWTVNIKENIVRSDLSVLFFFYLNQINKIWWSIQSVALHMYGIAVCMHYASLLGDENHFFSPVIAIMNQNDQISYERHILINIRCECAELLNWITSICMRASCCTFLSPIFARVDRENSHTLLVFFTIKSFYCTVFLDRDCARLERVSP